jgi:hypothetical protein
MDPARGDVLVRGGRSSRFTTKVRLPVRRWPELLKLFGIYVGFSIEFATGAETIVTTRVRQIDIVPSRPACLSWRPNH